MVRSFVLGSFVLAIAFVAAAAPPPPSAHAVPPAARGYWLQPVPAFCVSRWWSPGG